MKVLFLGPNDSPLIGWLSEFGDEIFATMNRVDDGVLERYSPDFLVSYGYRHIIKGSVLDDFPSRAINLHISLLPWNRGADPNLWSFIDNTPKGVTIHYLADGIDTGDIIVQREVTFSDNETLRTSYAKLQREIEALFRENWPYIRVGHCTRRVQREEGSFHKASDKDLLAHLLVNGWDTPVSQLTSAKVR